MWTDRFLKKHDNSNFEKCRARRVLAENLMIRVNTKYCNSVWEFISAHPLPKWGGTCRIIDAFRLLRAVTHCNKETDSYCTKTFWGPSHLFLVTIVDTIVLPNNVLAAQQNQIDWNNKIKHIVIPNCGPETFALI